MTTAKGIAGRLRANPLFHMSLGSKELFHSNFLAWLAGQHEQAARAAFEPWCEVAPGSRSRPPRREKQGLDIAFFFTDVAPLIVENKMFSLPSEAQLARYVAGPISKYPRPRTLVLLSLADPGWPEGICRQGADHWRWRSYGELATRLNSIIPAVGDASTYNGRTLEHYIDMVGDLVDLNNQVQVGSDLDLPVLLPPKVREELGEGPLWDAARKLRLHAVEQHLRSVLRDDAVGVELSCGFSNGAPFVEAFLRLEGRDDVGWQFQHQQFRLAVRLRSLTGREPKHKASRESRALELEEWFDFGEVRRTAGGDGRGGRKAFNHYDPDFVYRYVNARGLSVRQLTHLAVHYIRRGKAMAPRVTGSHSVRAGE